MSNKGEKEKEYLKLIEQLKNDKSQREIMPEESFNLDGVAEPENFKLLTEHWKFLSKKRKTVIGEDEKELSERIGIISQYMIQARFGDRNVGRFNTF